MSDEVAVKVDGVYKNFKLPHERTNSLKSLFVSLNKKTAKGYETQHALKNISFEVRKGEFFGIVGRNGSGKSTLLKIIAEIYQPSKGTLTRSGKLVPFIELGVGFNPELTGRENVYLNGALLGFSSNEIDGMYDDIVEFAELERFMDQKLKNYSSGMQVRLAFAVATRAKADILLIDEVLAVGDTEFQRKCFDYFKKLKSQETTVIFVSHDMNAIREYCDRAVLIEKSELVVEGTSDEVATAYSKMFIQSSKGKEGAKSKNKDNSKRWGNGDLQFNNISLKKKTLSGENKELVLETEIRAVNDIDSVTVGFYIKNANGMPIVGTNNQILNIRLRNMSAGDTRKLVWRVPNIFSEGGFDITLALEGDASISDWWEDALHFEVLLENRTPYVVSPKIALEYEE